MHHARTISLITLITSVVGLAAARSAPLRADDARDITSTTADTTSSTARLIDQPTLTCWPPSELDSYLAYEQALINIPTRDNLLRLHTMLADEPHTGGSPGDWVVINELVQEFNAIGSDLDGWSVEVERFWPLLSRPIDAALEIIGNPATGEPTLSLELRERALPSDPASQLTDYTTTLAWNAYSASGDVTAEVVYANYGTKQDFEQLEALGIDCTGKIVLARYGGNYRGFKAKYAQAAGAAGLIIFTDPADSGYTKGDVYPEGGWANDCCIQRGSIVTLGYQGDPLTPGIFASKDAPRLDPDAIALPRIPVQPIGYGAAAEIIKRMKGPDAPERWKGGLPMPYPLTGGSDLRVRVMVKQQREIMETANVIATLEGSGTPEERAQKIILGCHHDAWINGAGDAMCGMITMLETARSLATLAKEGKRPRRTIVFIGWGAEEFGIIGSSEYVEKRRDELTKNAIAYINLDMAAMGPHFGSSASPELKPLIHDAAKVVPAARERPGVSVYDEWLARAQPLTQQEDAPRIAEPPIGDLGGGSDHVPLLMHAGVPSASLGAGGSPGVSYHSIYDSLPWYWKIVGDDYEPALMITRMATVVATRLADAPVVPMDQLRVYQDLSTHLARLDELASTRGLLAADPPSIRSDWRVPGFDRIHAATVEARARATGNTPKSEVGSARFAPTYNPERINRRWLVEEGIPGRPWFRNWYVSTDETSGYANWMLPGLRKAIEDGDRALLDASIAKMVELIERQ